MTIPKKVVVVGGGASGMMAAGTAGSRGFEVTLVEKNLLPGRKIMITGKGRCNLTNDTDVDGLVAGVAVNGKFLFSAFNSLSAQDTISFFNNRGLLTKTERGRRVFPVSDSAASVVDVLRRYLKDNRVMVIKGEVTGIMVREQKVAGLLLKDGTKIPAHSVIIATGGLSYPKTGSTGDGYRFARELGHSIVPLKASLVPLVTEEEWIPELQGLSLRNIRIRVINNQNKLIFDDFGEMLFTHFGLSGPLILSASSFMKNIAKEKYSVLIDLKPALSDKQLDDRIKRDFEKVSRKLFLNSLNELLPKKLIPVIIKLSGISGDKPVNQITKREREELGQLLKTLPVTVKAFRPVGEAIITSGGISVREINPSTMESRIIRNLFFAGEVIDVDGYTGGYNLQIAFSTGYLAAINV